jgi:hypothetical protein
MANPGMSKATPSVPNADYGQGNGPGAAWVDPVKPVTPPISTPQSRQDVDDAQDRADASSRLLNPPTQSITNQPVRPQYQYSPIGPDTEQFTSPSNINFDNFDDEEYPVRDDDLYADKYTGSMFNKDVIKEFRDLAGLDEEDNIDNQGLPHKDEWEYDREGDMAKDQLHTIVRHAEELERALGDTENLPEWVQEKMAQIKGMMMGVTDYMMTQHERGQEQRRGEEGIHGDEMEEGNEFSGALAQAKANHQDEFEVGGKTYDVRETKERTMSRAAKGYEKYGKEGMQALAKAGREGKDLDKVRDKYNKYDDNVEEGREVNPIVDSLALMKRLAGLK